jgi:hypothetical protein
MGYIAGQSLTGSRKKARSLLKGQGKSVAILA